MHPSTVEDIADVALLRSRALTRAKRFEEALEAASISVFSLDPDRAAATYLLQSMALARMERLSDAKSRLNLLKDVTALHRTVQAEIYLQHAYVAFKERDYSESRSFLVRSLGKADDIVLARAQEMVGYVNVAEEKYVEAARSFQQAMATLGASRHRDGHMELNIFCMSAALATERLDTDNLGAFDAAYERLRWPQDVGGMRFQAEQNLGMLHFVAGDMEAAWRHLSVALRFAGDDPAWKLMAHANLMMLHRTLGETFTATQHATTGAALLSKVDWTTAQPNRRGALFEYLTEAVRLDVPVDARILQPLASLPGAKSVKRDPGADRRFQAIYFTARGNVLGKSDGDRAVDLLNRALDAWIDLGYRYRIATTAMDLYRLTRNQEYLEIAMMETRANRSGFLSRTLREANRSENHGLADLSKAERRLLPAIIDGKSSAIIAEETGRAEQTIKNQIRSIYARLGVKTRVELVKLCNELGLVS